MFSQVAATGSAVEPARRVRTRFAPSPTGMLHIGGLRTALFSYLLARHFDGAFILRIEDTDQKRLVPGALENIIESLLGMGLPYDEGPDKGSAARLSPEYGTVRPELLPDFGGDYGPYLQSQRLPRYLAVIHKLLETRQAYYAFETKEELDAARVYAEAHSLPYRYDRKFRDCPVDESLVRVAAGEPHAIRFKMPTEGIIRTPDALRGVIEWAADTQDDFIILKGDGFPPYHLAAMVDDHDMEISHVLRGEEWISSFPKHVCIFQALGWELPVFVHTPSVLGPDGKKLSKRHGAKGVGEYLDEGFLRETLVNFLALVGWSPGDDTEIMPYSELVGRFDVAGISVSPAILDVEKMRWMNGKYISGLTPSEFVERALPFLARAGLLPANPSADERDYAVRVIALEQQRVKLLSEVPELTDFFFAEMPEYADKSVAKWLRREGVPDFLEGVSAALTETNPWDEQSLEAAVRGVGATQGREKGELTHPLRVALSGREVGPGLYEMMAVLGRARVLQRLAHAGELARA